MTNTNVSIGTVASVLDFRPPTKTDGPCIEMEEGVLGWILLDPDILPDILALHLQPTDFLVPAHRRVFRAALEIHKSGGKPDANILAHTMAQSGELDEIGGKAKLAQLLARQPVHSGMVFEYARTLKENATRHYFGLNFKKIAELAEAGDFDSAFKQAKEQVARIEQNSPNDPDERLRLELKTLLSETDPIKAGRHKAQIASHYRLPNLAIEVMLKHLKVQTSTPESTCFMMEEFLTRSQAALEYVVPGVLPKGESILFAAMPKCGKTLLSIDLAYAVATGTEFLGEPVTRGKVLLVSVDESEQSLRHKLEKRGFTAEDDRGRIMILTRWDISQLGVLEEKLESFQPDVTIIDSVKRITCGSPISENSAEFADNLYMLKETLTRHRSAGVLVHHTNKDKEAQGVYQIRGSSAIAGACWGTWQMRHILKPDPQNKRRLVIDPKESKRVLEIYPRDAEGQTLMLDRDPENNHWIKLGAVGESAENQTMRQRIHALLELNRHKEGLTTAEMRELLNLEPDERYIWTALDRMVERREIQWKRLPTDRRTRVYFLPVHSGDTPPPSVISRDDDYHAEIPIQQDFQDSHQIVITPPEIVITPNAEESVMTNLNPDPASVSGDSHHPSSEGGGESVPTPETECKESPAPPKERGRVRINCPGSKRHGKTATILRLYSWKGMSMADLAVDGEGFQPWAADVNWLEVLE